MTKSTTIFWFRRDLRLADNPALLEALESADQVVPLFVDDPQLRVPSGPNRLSFLLGCLAELRDATDGNLVLRGGDPTNAVVDLAREVEATTVWCAEDFGPYGIARDEQVEQALTSHDISLNRVGSPYAVPPGTVFNKAGDNYKVFTPFSKQWRAHGWDDPHPSPDSPAWVTGIDSNELRTPPATEAELPSAGEAAAHARLASFLDGDVQQYAELRNRPDIDGTSRLSPYLKWGCIHPRQILDWLDRRSHGAQVFEKELCWREFYADVLFHSPASAHSAFNPEMAAMKVDSGAKADERFAAWRDGKTGYPIVDAGMRQLIGEGWMHNRVRMIVASFLVKDLHLDWTLGARHFMHYLVDGDLASNQHGWQWTAGTGTDAAPYFRVFNPVLQGKKFDPSGDYVRRWVPELRGIAGVGAHEPWNLEGDLFGGSIEYVPRVVDHFTERDEALARYDSVRSNS